VGSRRSTAARRPREVTCYSGLRVGQELLELFGELGEVGLVLGDGVGLVRLLHGLDVVDADHERDFEIEHLDQAAGLEEASAPLHVLHPLERIADRVVVPDAIEPVEIDEHHRVARLTVGPTEVGRLPVRVVGAEGGADGADQRAVVDLGVHLLQMLGRVLDFVRDVQHALDRLPLPLEERFAVDLVDLLEAAVQGRGPVVPVSLLHDGDRDAIAVLGEERCEPVPIVLAGRVRLGAGFVVILYDDDDPADAGFEGPLDRVRDLRVVGPRTDEDGETVKGHVYLHSPQGIRVVCSTFEHISIP
jgi:hypothetical protein